MAAHRYWRVWVFSKAIGDGISIAELELRESIGGSDVTGSGTASASSNYGTDTPAKAFDNNNATWWSGNNLATTKVNQWLAYDFGAGSEKDIVEFAITGISVNANFPMHFMLQYSDDNSAWTTTIIILDQTGWSTGEQRVFDATDSLPLSTVDARRYWRIRCMPGIRIDFVGFTEAQLRESVGGADVATGGVAAASGEASGNTAANAFDNSTATNWMDNIRQNNYLQYDFGVGVTKTIVEWALQCRTDTANYMPQFSILQMSSDGSTWDSVAVSGLQTDWATSEVRAFSVPSPGVSPLEASAGSFELAGQAASLLVSRKLSAASGSFALSGQSALLLVGRTLSASSGAFALTGNDANLLASRMLSASAGEFDLTGQDAVLRYVSGHPFPVGTGSFGVTGQSANLIVSRILSASAGEFALTGQDAALDVTVKIEAETGAFVVSGQDASLLVHRVLTGSVGIFELTGIAADLDYVIPDLNEGTVSAKVINPHVILQVSHDGGFTWGNEHWRPLGRVGQFFHQVQWNRLGRGRDTCFRIIISDPVKVAITGATISAEVGRH